MRQRSAALLAAVTLFVVLAVVAAFVPVPYAVLGPGPACNTVGAPTGACQSSFTTGLIRITPAPLVHPKHDFLYLTTVSETTEDVSILQAVHAYFTAGDAVIPRAVLIPPGQSNQQVSQQDNQEMAQSQSSAAVAAMTYLGFDRATVVKVVSSGPSARTLSAGDVIERVDQAQVRNAAQLVNLVQSHPAGSRLSLQVSRSGVVRTVQIVSGSNPQAKSRAYLGIQLTDTFAHGIKISVGLRNIGGPSAGLMLTLGVIDQFEPASITGGRVIAGTGTISDAGVVGTIGGIPQKMYAARHDAHASIFFAPAGDCPDTAGAIPSGLQVIKVTTLSQVLNDLAGLRAGRTDFPGC